MTRPERGGGFTLLEVLIALAILAVAFGFALEAILGGAAWLERARGEQQAVRIANGLLARLGQDLPVRAGHQAGQTGRYGWTLDIDPARADPPPTPTLAAHGVAVTVDWHEAGYDRKILLRSIRLGPRDEAP